MRKQLPALLIGAVLTVGNVWAAGSATQPTICVRSCWEAQPPSGGISQMSDLNRAIIHHTAGSTDYDTTGLEDSKAKVRGIQSYHMSLGWSDIGYHFLSDKFGNIFEGRDGSMTTLPRGAHDAVNDNSFGFSMMGYFHTPYNDVPTEAHRSAHYDVIAWRILDPFDAFDSGSYGGSTVGFLDGHRAVSATACPGDLMWAYIGTDYFGGEARTEVNARITGGSGGTTVIVDNDDGAPAYTETGTWTTSTSTGYNGGTYRYATVAAAHTATWTANLAEAGYWQVSVIYRAGTNRATSAKYDVATASGTETAYVDQTVNDLIWVSLGTYEFNAGDNTVTLDALGSSGNSVVIADAVKFVQAAPPPPDPVSVHVSDILLALGPGDKGKKTGQAMVTIVNDQGDPVVGATVTGTFTGDFNETKSAATNGSGVAVLTTDAEVKKPSFTFCVDDVSASLPYEPDDNVETCDSM